MKKLEKQFRTRTRDNMMTRSTTENVGYKFLKFISENEGSATQDVVRMSVLGHSRPGYFTNIFSDLVHNNFCFATYKDGYHITQEGLNILSEVEAR
jgi:predicted transcriptional regulator